MFLNAYARYKIMSFGSAMFIYVITTVKKTYSRNLLNTYAATRPKNKNFIESPHRKDVCHV